MANNRLAFGLCKQYGIELPKNATPKDAWDALDKSPTKEFKKLLLARQEPVLKDRNKEQKPQNVLTNNARYNIVKQLLWGFGNTV